MTEDTLKYLSLDELFDLMSLTISEFLAMQKTDETVIAIKQKQLEVELMHRVIITKRAEVKPVLHCQ